MRLRLLRRRLTISAPSMAVRSALPWPFRWAVVAIVFGFCAAIGLWAFEFGKDIAGLEGGSREQVLQLQAQVQALQSELSKTQEQRDQAQSIANTADTLVTAEKASKEQLLLQVKQTEAENRRLRDDLGFFEKLIPSTGTGSVAIRGLQAELQGGSAVRWQVLVIQANRNALEFSGTLDITFVGLQNGKPWSSALPGGPQAITLKQYGRLEGVFELPPQVVLKSVSAKVLQGNVPKSTQTIKL
ncbi:DUF6776 family protein [Rhodoferax sp.]|jgi:hypothetical protein|uniref:DUF6776 family protein n=1 Tax=Rhodoferax sp. TaxID=50421 RepID=UPI003784B4C2